MATDIGPIVQRLLQRLVLAGVPLMVAGCGSGGGRPLGGMDGGPASGGAFGQSGGSSAVGGGGGAGGRVGTGGSGVQSGGAGGLAVGGGAAAGGAGGGVSATGGASSAGQGGAGTGGAAGSGSGGTGGAGGTGGTTVTDAGIDGADDGQSCAPLTVTCGNPTLSCPSPFPDGGTGTFSISLPTSTSTRPFDPADARWAEMYRACVASGAAASCGPACLGFCQAVVGLHDGSVVTYGHLKCEIPCGAGTVIASVSYVGSPLPVCGRRPGGGIAGRCRPPNEPALGRLLAEAAELEAASVPAFRRVAADLATHGAPADLIASARAAVVDEARHWRRTRQLARRRGGVPVRLEVAPAAPGSLEQLALDNVVEGCVRETFGAMVAAYQAAHAADPDVATLMADIAEDELNHATLAWQIDAWASTKLSPEFQLRRNLAARAALRELILTSGAVLDEHSSAQTPADGQASAQAGLPSSDELKRLMATAWSSVWERGFALPPSAPSAGLARS